MPGRPKLKKLDKPLFWAAGTLAVLLAVSVLVWLALVRPELGKGRSESISDDYSASTILQDGQTASQTFTFDENLLAVGVEFYLPGGQPEGELELVLTDADTGEELARSTGVMGYIVPAQYTVLGLDREVQGTAGRRYQLSLTPHYTGTDVLAIGHSSGVALWQDPMQLDGSPVDGTMAVQVTCQRIGGYLTRFFLLICGFAALLAAFTVWAVLSRKVRLPRLVFVLVLGLGVLYSFVLPPYAAPDEKYHINQSFTLACRWANFFSDDGWQMGHVPTTTSFRRETDVDATLQDENTTVFTWQEFTGTLFTTTDASFDSHQEYAELQTDQNPLLYLVSGAAVFLAYLLHWGFTPALALGRLANLLLFAALAAWAVRVAPFGKRVFAAVALLPMTLHLAASFSRDAPLLGLCFAFTALVLDAAFGPDSHKVLSPARLAALLLTGVLLAPGKMVYLPLAALVLLVPGLRLGRYANAKKAAYLAACVLLALVLNTGTLAGATASSSEEATASTVAETTGFSPVSRTEKARPTEPDDAYEDLICGENTLENYVRRLYYYVEDTRDPAQSEVDFWVQALKEGDVSPVVLGQTFLFNTDKINSYTDGEDVLSQASLALLGEDLVQTGNTDLAADYATGGAQAVYKVVYSLEYCKERFAELGLEPGVMDDRLPLDRDTIAAEVQAAQATRATQSVTDEADSITYTPGYILTHLYDTVLLLVRSAVENGDHYLRTLVGGSLSYYSLDLAWGWVVLLYLLLVYAALPVQGASLLPVGRGRVWCGMAAVLCCLLAVAGCLLWTPTHYDTLYGLQGRYFLPVLPLLLLVCLPRQVARVTDEDTATVRLMGALALTQFGVLMNTMLAVIAR
ncbi:DUF2142 domain-containing protein [Subdoligranulum variabile]|uniref:DUF2142 domain-containing protein n=1 Tax=Subdoligranulum variabile DSM 15176 TaxID=411471 RepID=D1PP42_9FIRM|nr:DUF2142 domain-containing protein [Subdoligranulum variabile]EFB75538.1 hypothetical protein SUBVAR_06156 [Subdoligranulum variabile DSM 15176]UWP68984.1 DUF2142 domain-containing protein [Subdoligranulum variabile]